MIADSSKSKTRQKGRFSTQDFWPAIEKIGYPDSYWVGQRIQNDLAPDNILVFPVQPKVLSRSLGSCHPRFVLDIATTSRSRLKIADHYYELEADECALIFPHQFHYGSSEVDRSGWITVTFDLPNSSRIESLRNHPRRMEQRDILLLKDVLEAYRSKSPLALAFHLSRLLLSLCDAPEIPAKRRRIRPDHPERDDLLERINSYLDQNQEQNFTIERLAGSMGYSSNQLRTLFRKHVRQTSLGSYIRTRCITQAARMIQTTDFNITEIAQKLGFSSIHSFSRLFKTTYGISPKQYEMQFKRANGQLPAKPKS